MATGGPGFQEVRAAADQRALWVSTSLATHGGIATFVRNMQETDLWIDWNIRHIATHCNGTMLARLKLFASGFIQFIVELLVRRPDVVHIHTSSYGSFARKCILSWTAVLLRVPVILHVHGSEFHQFFNKAPRPAKQVIRSTLHRARVVIALGDTWASRLQRIAPKARIVVVPNAIRLRETVDQRSANPVHVVFLGEVCERKGAFLLIDAWSKLSAEFCTDVARLTIAGDGEVDRARKACDHVGIRERVDIRGWLNAFEVQQLLATAHVLVLPSLNEGQPMAILEAMSRGICVVASRSGGIPEMLSEESGVLIDPLSTDSLAEALRRVVNDREARSQYGERARRRVQQQFNVDDLSSQLNHLYHSVGAR